MRKYIVLKLLCRMLLILDILLTVFVPYGSVDIIYGDNMVYVYVFWWQEMELPLLVAGFYLLAILILLFRNRSQWMIKILFTVAACFYGFLGLMLGMPMQDFWAYYGAYGIFGIAPIMCFWFFLDVFEKDAIMMDRNKALAEEAQVLA